MSTIVQLRRPERRRLQKLARSTREVIVRNRCEVVLKVAAGASRRSAALQLGLVASTGWRTVERYLALGEAALFDGRRQRSAKKATAAVLDSLRRMIARTPGDFGYARPTWTLELVSLVLKRELRVELSVGHLWRVLRSLDIRPRRARPVVACPWPTAQREARIAELRTLASKEIALEPVYFSDEMDLHLNPRIGPDWTLPGQQRLVVTPGQNEKRFVAGAFDHKRGDFCAVISKRKSSWLFIDLLRALDRHCWWARRIHLIVDNYIIHKSKAVAAYLAGPGQRFVLHFLPPYCPSENRIERIWLDLHASVTRNHRCHAIDELVANVIEYIEARFGPQRWLRESA